MDHLPDRGLKESATSKELHKEEIVCSLHQGRFLFDFWLPSAGFSKFSTLLANNRRLPFEGSE